MVPYILVMYVQLKFQLGVLFICIFIHLYLQLSAIGVCNGFGMLIHWSRYWLGHLYTFRTVRFGLQSKPDHAKT
jgi:hypothetical protein